MSKSVVWFLRFSLIYFLAGAALGIMIAIWPWYFAPLRTVHVHLNLLGFVAMMVYAMAYHFVPIFSGHNIYSAKLIDVHLWAANVSLLVMLIAWGYMGYRASDFFHALLSVFGLLQFAGILMFAYNLLKTARPLGAEHPHMVKRPMPKI